MGVQGAFVSPWSWTKTETTWRRSVVQQTPGTFGSWSQSMAITVGQRLPGLPGTLTVVVEWSPSDSRESLDRGRTRFWFGRKRQLALLPAPGVAFWPGLGSREQVANTADQQGQQIGKRIGQLRDCKISCCRQWLESELPDVQGNDSSVWPRRGSRGHVLAAPCTGHRDGVADVILRRL